MINVEIIPVLKDNYTYVIRSEDGQCGVIDPGEADPVVQYLERSGLNLDYILNTHHHADHINGNDKLKSQYGAKIIGPEYDRKRIPNMDIGLHDQDSFAFGLDEAEIIATPGHTLGGICFYFPESDILFTGDTLFSMGCGRLFEGTPAQMYESLAKISSLPDETLVYCGHEYTLNSAEFCLSIEPDNKDLKERYSQVKLKREQNQPTYPVDLATEKKTNVFLRAKDLNHFTEIRGLRDRY